MQKLNIKEIFHSLQGEGGRAGENTIFIRLAGCNLNCNYCDTEYDSGNLYTICELLKQIKKHTSNWICWTGGEPTLQLNEDIIQYFKNLGYKQSIETNGTNPIPNGLDYITCSPKVQNIKENFPNGLNEIRLPFNSNTKIPKINDLPLAEHYYLSPIFLYDKLDRINLINCIKYIKENPQWKLSIQQHKIWNVQ